jgi:NAD(P)-dependent dehydrogenase (short-subunit alcohol dehydrogenase family)
MARTYLITGANRGIGLELATFLHARGDRVLGTTRDPAKAQELSAHAAKVLALDVADDASITALEKSLEGESVDVLINNAGVSSTARTLGEVTGDELQRVFRVNSFAPVLVAKAALAALKRGAGKQVLNISSQLGSITNHSGGSSYGYRGSKAALNMLTVCLHHELKGDGFTCVTFHPGWVRTDMGGPNAPLAPAESAASLVKVFDGLKAESSGKFLSFDGSALPW